MNRSDFMAVGLLLAFAMLAGCQTGVLSPADAYRIEQRLATLDTLAQIPRPIPQLIWSTELMAVNEAARTHCDTWSITLSYQFAAAGPAQVNWVIDKILPHEYGHLASCYYRGGTDTGDGNSHDEWWRQWVIRLGGDPDYV